MARVVLTHRSLLPKGPSLGARALMLGLLLLSPGWAVADGEGTRKVTVQEAVRSTLDNNHDLAAARLEVRRADARVSEAVGTALPRLDLSAGYTRALKKPVFFLPGDFFGEPGTVKPVQIGSTNSFSGTLSASQILFNSAVFVGVGAAKIYAKGAREIYRSKLVEVVTSSRKAYYGVLVAAEAVSLLRETLKNSEENLRTIRLLVSQGLVSEYDQLRAEVAVANIRPEVINAENSYQLAVNNLKNIMALPYDAPLEVVGTREYIPVPDSLIAAAQSLVLVSNPGLSGVKYAAEVSDAIVSAQKSEYLPVLSLFGNYQYQAQKNDMAFTNHDWIASSLVGLQLSMNIFNGLQTTARVEQAQLDYHRAEEQVAQVTQTLQSSTEAVILQLNRARLRIEAQGKTVEQADRGYRIATSRYASGLGTLLEVNDAQLAQIRAGVNRIQAVYDYTVSTADLDQLLGRLPDYVPAQEN